MAKDHLPLTSGPIMDGGNWREVALASGEALNGGFSGRFFTLNSSGYAEICDSDDQTISGWVESGTIASGDNTADALFKRPGVINDTQMVFRLPCDTAFTQTYKGQCCDLAVSGGIQYAALGTSTNDLLIIVDGYAGDSAAESYVDVTMNPEELYSAT